MAYELPKWATVPGEKPIGVELLYDVFFPVLGAFLQRLGTPRTELEDQIQDIFVNLLKMDPPCYMPGTASPKTFMFKLASYRFMQGKDAFQRHDAKHSPEPLEALVDDAPSASQRIARDQTWERLHEVINQLPRDQHLALVLFEFEKLSTKEVAEVLGVAPNTVGSRLSRARAFVAAQLSKAAA